MNLKDFVTQTLLDITEAVTEAQKKSLVHIAPGRVEGKVVRDASTIRFDIAVAVSSEAGGGISVWSLGDMKAAKSSSHTNTISFEVPVYFQAPTELNQKHYSRPPKK